MDSVTQLVLGAAVGHAALGRRVGKRAVLWGAVCGTLPDLDSFYPFASDVAAFTWHRGYSHSFFVLALVSPLIAWLIWRLNLNQRADYRGWLTLVFFALMTHPLLDCFTVYGTQVLLPFSDYPVSWSTIFIIDPMYTLPLLIGVLIALLRNDIVGARANRIGLTVGCVYLAFTVVAKTLIGINVGNNLAVNDVAPNHTPADILTTPAPFNILLWRILVRDGDDYLEGFDSLVDGRREITFVRRTTGEDLLTVNPSDDIERLKWFSHGHYAAILDAHRVKLCDLRMGLIDQFVFCFNVATRSNDSLSAVSPARRLAPERGNVRHILSWMWQRIWQWRKPPSTIASMKRASA